jgi:membrane-bound lytic murein transglycosylase MltF
LVFAFSGPLATADPEADPVVGPLLGEPWTGDLDGMVERRLIRVLVTYSKSNFFLDRGEKQGITYEIFQAFEKALNAKLAKAGRLAQRHLKVAVAYLPVKRDELLPYLVAGKGDIASANLTVTPERQALVDFTDAWYPDVEEVVVTGPRSPELGTLEDLAGREILVRESSSYFESLQRLNESFRSAGKEPVVLEPADEYLEDEDILEMVNAGLLPFAVVDSHKAELWERIFDGLVVRHDLVLARGHDIAWAIRQGSPQLEAELNAFIEHHRKGTLLGNILLKRYYGETERAKAALAQEELAKYQALRALFKRFGDQYDVDWLLATAQGYQESGLDQSVRSPAGAVGVMQLLPSTARDKSVGISHIERVENNVHAGIKYLDYIRDRYFSDGEVQPPADLFFALAAYNAGPARVAGLREKAAKRGLDPNKWFDHVEAVAAEEIGRESVQYVRNIVKYYIAYKLIAEREQAVAQRKAAATDGPDSD